MKVLVQTGLICMLFFGIAELAKRSSQSPHYQNPDFIRGVERYISFSDTVSFQTHLDTSHSGSYDTSGNFIVQQIFHFEEASKHPMAIRIEGLMSYEAYWDKHFIGQNGTVHSENTIEKEGKLRGIFIIPRIEAGNHILTLKASNSYVRRVRVFSIVVGEVNDIYNYPIFFIIGVHLLAGIFIVISIYNIIQFKNEGLNSYLSFGFLSFSFFSLIAIEYVRYYWNYPYSVHYQRLLVIELLTLLISYLLPYFFYLRFQLKKYKWLFLALLACLVFIELRIISAGHDLRVMYLYGIGITFSTIFIVIAKTKKKADVSHSILGIVPGFIVFLYYDLLLFAGFVNLIIFNLISLSKEQKKIRNERDSALLASTRLEMELLKKNIQPHFLMNTLTSIIEWVEKDPQVGVNIIEELAEEYQVLLKMSNQKMVPISEEIGLCQTHLKIMSYRKGGQYSLSSNIEVDSERIPPGIFHTVIENGISHSITNSSVEFHISETREQDTVIYEIRTIGPMLTSQEIGIGLGTTYIQTRLQENFPGKWNLDQKAIPEGWLTTISFIKSEGINSRRRKDHR